jgi:hypothetical protein
MDSPPLLTISSIIIYRGFLARTRGSATKGGPIMPTKSVLATFKVGDLVSILNSAYGRARIAEDRGPLGPRGVRVYRVRIQKKPRPAYIEVREDQLEKINK